MESLSLLDCARLAAMGGPEYRSRGLTLKIETMPIDSVLGAIFDIELLINSQESLLERAKRIYSPSAIAVEADILDELRKIATLSVDEQRHKILDLFICSHE